MCPSTHQVFNVFVCDTYPLSLQCLPCCDAPFYNCFKLFFFTVLFVWLFSVLRTSFFFFLDFLCWALLIMFQLFCLHGLNYSERLIFQFWIIVALALRNEKPDFNCHCHEMLLNPALQVRVLNGFLWLHLKMH